MERRRSAGNLDLMVGQLWAAAYCPIRLVTDCQYGQQCARDREVTNSGSRLSEGAWSNRGAVAVEICGG
jgi:hypothetical protein